jgi:hypothetical protein
MANIFTLEKFQGFSEKINIDELYEKKRVKDLKKLELFKKILNRVHVKIKTTAKLNNDKFCWYVIPEMIIGIPRYDQAGCIAYIMTQLESNGFQVRYYHPNTILISWVNWVPTYIRNELKKQTGLVVDEHGNTIIEENEEEFIEEPQKLNKVGKSANQINNSKKYTPINSYRPSGKLVYSDDLLNKLETKIG